MLKKTSFVLLSGIAPLFGQDFLDPLFVTATRSDQKASDAPYTTHYIDADFIRDQTRRTLPEALQYTPGILVQKTAHGHGSPYIRGFTGRQNLLLVDGIRVNNSTFRSGPIQYWNTIDALAIDHLELTKSQGSVLYGSDAVGGTVNSFTKSSRFRDEAAGKAYLGGLASYEFRTNGQGSHIGRLESETGILLGISAKDFGDIEDSNIGRMRHTGYPEQDLDLRFDWALTPESSLTLATYYVNQDRISRWHRLTANPGWTHDEHQAVGGRWQADTYDQERSMTYLRYAGENPQADAAITRWSATLSFQSTDDSEYQNRFPERAITNSSVKRQADVATETIGFDLLLESRLGPGSLIYGFDFYHDEVDSSGYHSNLVGGPRTEVLPIADDSDYDLFGAYAQYVWKPNERLEISGGGRYTYAEASLGRFAGGENESKNWEDVVGSLRGIYSFTSSWSVYGGISQAFRAPNLDDLTGNLAARSGGTVVGDLGVDPEKFLTYEVGTRQHTETSSINLALFYTDVDDLIVSTPIARNSSTSVANNAGAGYMYGVELEGAWRLHPQWTLSGFAAWQDGRTESPEFVGGPDVDKPNSRLLPLSGSVALRWNDAEGRFWVEGRVLAATGEERISSDDQAADNQRIPTHGTPGYVVTSLHAGWHVNESVDVSCGVENLGDEDYRIHGSGQNEPGLSGIFGVRVRW
jgi:hemoglobin/transferrin/lactoferrin receptor protein